MADVTALTEYYQNLLIIQYNNRDKAKATIGLLVDELLATGIYQDVRDAYSIDTAVGKQLDIIGKYVGVNRFFTDDTLTDDYFGFENAVTLGSVSANIIGFDDASSPDKSGLFLDAEDIIKKDFALNDDAFRTLIKLKIVQNNSNHSLYDVSKSMQRFFDGQIVVKDNYDMTMTYFITQTDALIKAIIEKNALPKPSGVEIEAIDGNEFFSFADANNLDGQANYLIGFNDASDAVVKQGGFLNANSDIL